MSKLYESELKNEVEAMITIAEDKYKKELDGCSFKYGTILMKMSNWIGYNSDLSDYIEEWFKNKYYDVYEAINNHVCLCYSHKTVIELLDISELDNLMREILEI